MPEGALPLLIAIIVLIIMSGFFSATETAYTSLNVIKVKSLSLKEKKYKKSKESIWDIGEIIKWNKIHLMGVPEG